MCFCLQSLMITNINVMTKARISKQKPTSTAKKNAQSGGSSTSLITPFTRSKAS